jgi:hypothetical protein
MIGLGWALGGWNEQKRRKRRKRRRSRIRKTREEEHVLVITFVSLRYGHDG